MKTALIFCNGGITDYDKVESLIKNGTAVICADGGIKHADRLGLIPQTIIGDLDSSPLDLVQKYKNLGANIIQYKSDKDETDSELAIQYAIQQGFKSLHIFGMFGNRFDHTFATLLFLSKQIDSTVKITIINENQTIYLVKSSSVIHGIAGETVSLIPLQDCHGVTLHGFQYPLHSEDLMLGTTRGISNVLTAKAAKIDVEAGTLLVVHTKNS